MVSARKFFLLTASLGVLLLLHSALFTFHFSLAPPARAVEGTLELKADVASFSGTFTQAGNQPIRTAFGPLRLDYKSGPDTWTTGLLIREGDGNVTIGAGITSADFASTSKLRVLGIVESTTGGFKFPDGTTQTTAAGALPAGMVSFFNLSACPTGWTELTAARGMTVVGLPAAGTLAGTVGSALTNLATRTITTVPAHTHAAGTLAADSAGAHTHSTSSQNCCGSGSAAPRTNTDTNGSSGGSWSINSAGAHTHTISGTSASTGSASVDVTMPYIQLLACEKS